jgi:tetrahydromethanopterin S-methyltransferase subunit C
MVAGRRYWIAIWYGILFLGALGLWSSLYWGRQTHWKNSDELLRAIGTITVSCGMLLLLNGLASVLGQVLLVAALVCFIVAFVLGRNAPPPPPDLDGDDDDEEGERGA